jgi:hypothetical protein
MRFGIKTLLWLFLPVIFGAHDAVFAQTDDIPGEIQNETNRTKLIMHGFCPSPDGNIEVWAYSVLHPLGGSGHLARMRSRNGGTIFFSYLPPDSPEMFFVKKDTGDFLSVSSAEWKKEVARVFTPDEASFLFDGDAMRRCIIAETLRKKFSFD